MNAKRCVSILVAVSFFFTWIVPVSIAAEAGDKFIKIFQEEIRPPEDLLPKNVQVAEGFKAGTTVEVGEVKKLDGRVLVVHADDGMDEISIGSATKVAELKDGKVTTYTIQPEDFGMSKGDVSKLAVSGAEDSLAVVKSVLNNEAGPARDIVVLNAGAAIYAAGLADSLEHGIKQADDVIASGKAMGKFEELIKLSGSFQ